MIKCDVNLYKYFSSLKEEQENLEQRILNIVQDYEALRESKLKLLLGAPDREEFNEAMCNLIDKGLIIVNYADFPGDPLIIYLEGDDEWVTTPMNLSSM